MSLTHEEVEQIAKETNKQEKKWLAPSLMLTFLLTVCGWGYSAGVLSTQVKVNTQELGDRAQKVNAIPEIQHDIEELKEDVDNNTDTLNRIETQQAVNKEILQRIEKKLN